MILVGTIHIDLEGPRRLEHLLQLHKPSVVTVEYPKNLSIDEMVSLLLARRAAYTEALQSAEVPAFLTDYFREYFFVIGYEVVVAAKYARREGTQIYPVDHPETAKLMSGETDKETFAKLLKGGADALLAQLAQAQVDTSKLVYAQFRPELVQQVDAAYFDPVLLKRLVGSMDIIRRQTEDLLKGIDEQQRRMVENPIFDEEREQYITNEVLERNPDIHIAGVAHISERPTEVLNVVPLYARLGNRVTERIRLCEVQLAN